MSPTDKTVLMQRGTLLVTLLMAIVGLGFAVGLAIDLYFKETIAHEEGAYEERLLGIQRGIRRFLMNNEWGDLMNELTTEVTFDKTLGDGIHGYAFTGSISDKWKQHRVYYLSRIGTNMSDYLVIGNYEDPNVYSPTAGTPFRIAQNLLAAKVYSVGPSAIKTLDTYKVPPNTIKLLRRLVRTGHLNMSDEDILQPYQTIFPYSNCIWLGLPNDDIFNPPPH